MSDKDNNKKERFRKIIAIIKLMVLAVIVAVILIIGFLLRDKLKKFADDIYQKIS